jgi:preprotein translocase subunit SecE
MMLPQNEHSLYARCGAVLGDIGKLPLLQHCAALGLTLKERAKRITFPKRPQNLSIAAITKSPLFQRSALFASSLRQRAKHLTWPSQRRRLALVAVGVVLAFTAAIAYRSRSAASSAESSTLPAAQSSAAQSVDQRPLIPKPTPGKRASEMRLASAASQPVKSEKSRLKRVRVSPTEVDYIGEDVTVRFFNDKPAPKRAQLPRARVAHIGNDVTVRYFTPNQPTTRTASR